MCCAASVWPSGGSVGRRLISIWAVALLAASLLSGFARRTESILISQSASAAGFGGALGAAVAARCSGFVSADESAGGGAAGFVSIGPGVALTIAGSGGAGGVLCKNQ